MKIFFVLFSIIVNAVAYCQTTFVDEVYNEIDVSTHSYYPNKETKLDFDYYVPFNPNEKPPLVVYVHGGGFSNGSRDSEGIKEFASKLAHRGYAVASISYRLTMKGKGVGCKVTSKEKLEAIGHTTFDVAMAVKHILKYDTVFEINKEKIVLMGSSAGAEAVLNLAYVYNYNKIINDFKFAGVIGMSGAITDLNSLSERRAIPAMLFHGTGDRTIPYNTGPHHYCGKKDSGYLMMYGSGPIAERLKGMGKTYYLYTINGGSHSWCGLPLSKSFDEIIDFLFHDIVSPSGVRQTERTITSFE